MDQIAKKYNKCKPLVCSLRVRLPMNLFNLRQIIQENKSKSCATCNKESKRRLTNSEGLEKSLRKLGDIQVSENKGYELYTVNGSNPFSESAPVSLSHYPYNDSSVYQCHDCLAIFIIYLETGGHAARYQARWVRDEIQFMS